MDSKVLIVKNDSSAVIDQIYIEQYVSGSKGYAPNALVDRDTIAVGGRRIFYLAPYSKSFIHLDISAGIYPVSISFTYEYEVNGRNEAITASYDGTEISVTGSGAEEIVPL